MTQLTDFRNGKQPCNNFIQQIEYNEHAVWGNQHECYRCGGVVAFCLNCHTDHHDGGYETCITKVNREDEKELRV